MTGSTGSCSNGRNTPSKSRCTSSWNRCDSSSARVDESSGDESSIVDSLVKAPFPNALRIFLQRAIRYGWSLALLAATASRCLCVAAPTSAEGNTPAAVAANDDDDGGGGGDDDDDDDDGAGDEAEDAADEAGAAYDEDEDATADGSRERCDGRSLLVPTFLAVVARALLAADCAGRRWSV